MKVLITGYGIKAPKIGSVSEFKVILENGKVIFDRMTLKNGRQIVCGVVEENLTYLAPKILRRYPKVVQMTISAAYEAIEMANLLPTIKNHRVGIIIGTSGGNIAEVEKNSLKLHETSQISPFAIGNMNTNSLSTSLSSFFNVNGISLTLCNSCTAGTDAINLGKTLIESGQMDICIVGGAESTITDVVLKGFSKLRVITSDLDPLTAGGPFSDDKGFVLSEGAGVLILESEKSALNRKIEGKGWIEGAYMNQDGVSIYQSDPTGEKMLEALQNCLQGIVPDYMNSQALGIRENDQIEAKVHQSLFTNSIPITSIKGMTGHFMGATGAIQAISSLISIENHFIPPTIKSNVENYSGLPIVTEAIYREVKKVGITSHGYGGNNSCLLLSKL